MDEKVISVIVPVYNVGKYLRDGLESIIAQTIFDDIEVILVNDGSSDDSLKICSEYEERFENFKLINKMNGGVSSARNKGLEVAIGKYIAFFDADDIAEPDLYESLYALATKNQADLAIVDFSVVHGDGKVVKKRKGEFIIWNDNEELMKAFLSGHIVGNNIFDKLYSRVSIGKIRFVEGKAVGEDMYFTYQVINNVHKAVADTNLSKYWYIKRPGSAMNSKFSPKYFDTVYFSNLMSEEKKNEGILGEYAEAHTIHEVCKVIEYMLLNKAGEEYSSQMSDNLMKVREYKLRHAYRYLSKKQFYGLVLMKISPKLYLRIFRMMRVG